MAVVRCGECEQQGPEFPLEATAREVHRALHGLGRALLEFLDPILEAFVRVKPLENLDFKIPELPEFKLNLNEYTFRGEVPPFPFPELPPVFVKPPGEVLLVMGGRDVGRATLDGEGNMLGEVLDPVAIAQLRADLLGGVSIAEEDKLVAFVEEECGVELLPWQRAALRRWCK